jgi:lipoprotein signal peptidase
VFIVYAVPLGLLLGFLLGGRLEGLSTVRFRWAWLAFAGLAAQVVLFGGAVDGLVGSAGPGLYVASTVAVLVAVVRNIAVPGLALVALGAVSNLAAIVANGGYMPTDPAALAFAGLEPSEGFSNSVVDPDPALRPLTDVFALPAGMPMANVFSVGDVLIGVGVAVTIVHAMRRRPGQASRADAEEAATGAVRAGTSPD